MTGICVGVVAVALATAVGVGACSGGSDSAAPRSSRTGTPSTEADVLIGDPRAYDGYYAWQVYVARTAGTMRLPEGWRRP